MTEAVIYLVAIVTLLLGSPGPAPLALAAVGASFGVKKGVPFLIGILCGLCVVIIGATLGLSSLFSLYPSARTFVQIVGGLYILYVAVKIAMAPVVSDAETDQRIPTFLDGFVFNILNPKAYAAFFAIFSQFLLPLENQYFAFLSTSLICLLVAMFVDSIWLMLGGVIRPLFRRPVPARVMRIVFASLMVLAVGWTFYQSS